MEQDVEAAEGPPRASSLPLVGSAFLGKVAKQGAVLGLSAAVVSVIGYAVAYTIA